MNLPDLRPQLMTAQTRICELVAATDPEQLDLPTPCSEFTVTGLVEHLFGVQLRIISYATTRRVGDSPAGVPLTSTDPAAIADQLRDLAAQGQRAWADWSAADLQTQTVTGPFGTVPGGVALAIMTSENVVHGWDLAVATDQPSEGDPQTATLLLAMMQRALPAEPRGGAEIPFAAPVTPAADAGPTERLAAWTGRVRPMPLTG
ncbi:uncharacterized protein (TIGR03086 family) [Propionibacteriaceae bacterium ES.041]|uniref:TIGR03086 family protein n=1 Tax=Enemella evansiae TaxID=2016499 RepID=A0A255G1T8_9ACTN|nr:TIGR03086 family metal-binding protein [Enemella evansiae]OYO00442.1 TIGR03086 family protein [Enemella evansiae]OYO09541.1 TIGR03086 family protein [Enemella evansiae]PFG66913.1 uncharacterized protein (TIGR03086 family) [Propionibacteriaceae bacterium ES.041]